MIKAIKHFKIMLLFKRALTSRPSIDNHSGRFYLTTQSSRMEWIHPTIKRKSFRPQILKTALNKKKDKSRVKEREIFKSLKMTRETQIIHRNLKTLKITRILWIMKTKQIKLLL